MTQILRNDVDAIEIMLIRLKINIKKCVDDTNIKQWRWCNWNNVDAIEAKYKKMCWWHKY